jgi:hypothetical protein
MSKNASVVVTPAAELLPPEPERRRSFGEIVAALNETDRLLSDGNIEPAELLGAIKANDDELRDKVDAVRFVSEEFRAYAKRMAERAAYYSKKAKAAENNADRLEDYVAVQMRAGKFDRLPGHVTALVLKPASTPTFNAKREPVAADVMNEILAPLIRVKVSKTTYEWDAKAIKDAVKAGTLGADILAQIGTLDTSTSLVFEDTDKPNVKPKKKGAK